MVKERITTIEELVKILELMIDKKGGVGGYIDDTFEIKKSEKAFFIKSKENTTTIEIPHSNCFSIEENVKRFEYALSVIGITNSTKLTTSKLLEDIEELEKRIKQPVSRFDNSYKSKEYKISSPNLKEYKIELNNGKEVKIPRFAFPNPIGSIKMGMDKLVEVGFENNLVTVAFSEPTKDIPLCAYCNKPVYGKECNCRNVNHPNHYSQGKIECIEAMKSMLTKEEFRGFLRGSIFKYQWRVMDKNGIEDLEKAKWYLDYLIKELRELEKKD